MICIEVRHAKAFLSVSTGACQDIDQPEAPGFAQARKLLQDKAIAIENDIRGLLRNFGLKVGESWHCGQAQIRRTNTGTCR